jgi:hypothetical protein
MPHKVWQDLGQRDLAQLDLDLDQKAASSDQVVQDQVVPEAHVQDLVPQNLEWVAQVPQP